MDAEPIECSHCQHVFNPGDPWITLYPRQPYGDGPASKEEMWLCGFCDHTLACSSWRAGFPANQTVQDVAAMLNITREQNQPKRFTRPERFATGGIIKAPTTVVIGEVGPE